MYKPFEMETIQIRQKLHDYIDAIDEKKLEAIYLVLSPGINENHTYSPDELAAIYQRRKEYLQGEGQSFTVEESIELIRKGK